MSVPKSRITSMSESCPTCDSETGLREILYGLPAEPVDESKYVIGGCCVWEGMPLYKCIECNWESTDFPNAPENKECWYCGQSKGLRQINFRIQGTSDYNRFVWEGGDLVPDPNPIYRCELCGWRGSLNEYDQGSSFP